MVNLKYMCNQDHCDVNTKKKKEINFNQASDIVQRSQNVFMWIVEPL